MYLRQVQDMAGMRNQYFVSNAGECDGFGEYEFKGWGTCISGECISAADRDGLWADVWAALGEMDGRRTDVRSVLDPQLLERLETRLRAVLHRVFVPLQTEEGWASAFHVARMIPQNYENVDGGHIQCVGVWLDGRGNAQARVIFGWNPDRAPSPASMRIKYTGRQHFGTFHKSNGSLTRE
jgi:hypothetical protein